MIVGASSNIGSRPGQARHDHAAGSPEARRDDNIRPAGTDVVTLDTFRRPAGVRMKTRPDPAFVTHLIAMAEQAPQTRTHRRASVADAMSGYRVTSGMLSGEMGPAKHGLSRIA